MQTYIWINIVTLIIPVALSFTKKTSFHKDFAFVLAAITITAAFFIVWDHFFTVWCIWGFNKNRVSGIYWFNLPLEEILLYFTLPYLCLFMYAYLKVLVKKDILKSIHKLITTFILLLSIILFFSFPKYLYTSIISLACTFLLLCHSWIARPKSLGRFYLTYFICLVPFLVIYYLLTNLPVIWYDSRYIMGLKIFNIPIEALFNFLALLLMNIGIFDYLKKWRNVEIVNELIVDEKEVVINDQKQK